jgi:hypothetical protein
LYPSLKRLVVPPIHGTMGRLTDERLENGKAQLKTIAEDVHA